MLQWRASRHIAEVHSRNKSADSLDIQGGPAKVKPTYIFAGNVWYLNVYDDDIYLAKKPGYQRGHKPINAEFYR